MNLRTATRMLLSGAAGNFLLLMNPAHGLYRICFIAASLKAGLYARLAQGPASLDELLKILGPKADRDGLAAWLELGVSLKELRRKKNAYLLSGRLSRMLLKPASDPLRALLEEMIILHIPYLTGTLSELSVGRKFPFDESYGELVARASRLGEEVGFEVVDRIIPRSGNLKLLEIGCGSGIYIKRACERNKDLRAVGVELQPEVADFARKNIAEWGFSARVEVIAKDIREYQARGEFDLVTLHNLIYYFPEANRPELLKLLGGFLKLGGKLVITAAGQGGKQPFTSILNLWGAMTEGSGPLPHSEKFRRQLADAGFTKTTAKNLVPMDSYWLFTGRKGKGILF